VQRRVIVQRRLAASALVVALGVGAIVLVTSGNDSGGGSRVSARPDPSTTTRVRRTTSTVPRRTTTTTPPVPAIDRPLRLERTITGAISPKSVVATGTGLVFAQNMMYRHTMTVYDDAGSLVKTIPDGVDLAHFGYDGHAGVSQGAPVEGAVSPDGRYFYVTNYSMYGANFGPEGSDNCRGPGGLSPSFVYRVSLATLAIDAVWPDSAGLPLRETFRKSFHVGPPDRDPPAPEKWKIKSPKAGHVVEIRVAEGATVNANQVLAVVE